MARVTSHKSRVTSSQLWTIVPVKGIAAGKSRLAAALGEAARARLNRWLLERTLGTVASADRGLRRCVVVSPCEIVLGLAHAAGAVTLHESKGAGLNRAIARAASAAAGRGASSVLVIPCDLPWVTAAALAALTQAARAPHGMVIAPDRAGTGTNALLVGAEQPLEFRFGKDSFARHLLLARERGWNSTILSRADLAFDLDTPEDLASWQRRKKGMPLQVI